MDSSMLVRPRSESPFFERRRLRERPSDLHISRGPSQLGRDATLNSGRDTPDSEPGSPAEVEFQKHLNMVGLLRNPIWILGMIVFVLGNFLNFIALQFAAQSLVAPLGSISLVVNVIIAPLINRERWTWKDIVGVVLIVGGSSMTVAFAGVSSKDYKLCVLLALFRRTPTIVFLTVTCSFAALMFVTIGVIEKNIDFDDSEILTTPMVARAAAGRTGGRADSWSSRVSGIFRKAKGVDELPDRKEVPTSEATLLNEDGVTAPTATGSGESSNPAKEVVAAEKVEAKNEESGESSGNGELPTITVESPPAPTSESEIIPQRDREPTPESTPAKNYAIEEDAAVEPAPHRPPTINTNVDKRRGRRQSPSRATGVTATPASPLPPAGRLAPLKLRYRNFKKAFAASPPAQWWKRVDIYPKFKHKISINSVPVRVVLPFAYASLGGLMATITVLFAKATIHLLSATLFGGDNQYNNVLAWVITFVTVFTAVGQVYWINMGLQRYDALLQIPVFYTVWTFFDVVGGGVYFDEFRGFTTKQYGLFILGVAVIFAGVAVLAGRLKKIQEQEKELPGPGK
ncbi:hypothetical protein HK104_010753 [Borealophlyctis nickersoniae]|nr:hypothetical protein HK104_010753 [Borealophlyctis nickersoniae]